MRSIEDVMNEWNALQPLSDRDREMLSRRFTIDFNYNSNHIEGNTLTYGQTEILLIFGKIVGEADVRVEFSSALAEAVSVHTINTADANTKNPESRWHESVKTSMNCVFSTTSTLMVHNTLFYCKIKAV